MQLSKENSGAGGATGASARPPAAAYPPPDRGQGARRLQPSPPSAREEQPCGHPSRRPALRSPAARPPPLGLEGTRRPDGHRAVPARGARSTRHRGAGPRSAPPLPAPAPCPLGEEGRAPTWLSPGPARSSSASSCPHARQPAAFKSPGYSAGGESMRAGAARRGRGEAGRRGSGGVGWSPSEESARSPSCLCSRDRDGQPPRGSQTALSLPRAVYRPLAAHHPNI